MECSAATEQTAQAAVTTEVLQKLAYTEWYGVSEQRFNVPLDTL